MLGDVIVIYLDVDTIVQADPTILRDTLLASNKTVGFVKRSDFPMLKIIYPSDCTLPRNHLKLWTWRRRLRREVAYNVGVFAVNLGRWKRLGVARLVEALVQMQIHSLVRMATRVKICTKGDDSECVISRANALPVKLLRAEWTNVRK